MGEHISSGAGAAIGELELRTGYWDDAEARRAFKEFVLQIHGLDFSAWEDAGFWDPAFTPFSYFEGGRVVASVCLYLLDAVVEGRATQLVQISTVGTDPGWRRRGLNRELTDVGLEWAGGKHEGVFLFADEGAIPYYEKCGFSPIQEHLEIADPMAVRPRSGLMKLDPGVPEDRDLIHRFAERRSPVSARFSVGSTRLLMFHALYTLRDHAYEIRDLDTLVFFKRQDGCLSVLDVVAKQVPPFEALYPYIADPGDTSIEFHFSCDKLGLERTRRRPLRDNHPFTCGGLPVEDPVFPYTCRA